jgi:ABC-type multidrug transport system fused ATPase/permease subunit
MGSSLTSWFAIWHPRYRSVLVQLLLAGTLASGLVYVQNSLLAQLAHALAGGAAPAAGGHEGGAEPDRVPHALESAAASLGVGLPLLVLGLFIACTTILALISFWKNTTTGRLTIRTKDDLETEILLHLLRKDDAFFGRHAPAEIVNRLATDLYRISFRRANLGKAWWAVVLVGGSLAFFVLRDWRLALVAVAACVVGALWALRMTHPVAEMDAHYLKQDDRIKSRFEDLLRAAPEVQTGYLYDKVRGIFTRLQEERTRTYLGYIRLNAILSIGHVTWYLMAFVAMILVVLYLRSTGAAGTALALVPVVIWSLPALFEHAADLAFLNLEFRIARDSMQRLMEYESHEGEAEGRGGPAEAAAPAARDGRAAGPLAVEDATYRYAGPDSALQGGISGVSTAFGPDRWTAVVGGAGSGKSTLLKLLLGRLRPQTGRVVYGAMPVGDWLPGALASEVTFMPQSPALLDASIRENLQFGSSHPPGGPADGAPLAAADLEVIEGIGLGLLCRQKALDRTPQGPAAAGLDRGIADVRRRARQVLRERCGAVVRPYEEGHADPRHWVLESLLGGACDRGRTIQALLDRRNAPAIGPLLATGLGDELVGRGQDVLRSSRHLLAIPNVHVYRQLAPVPLDERLWSLRSSNLALADLPPPSIEASRTLALIALTSSPAESAAGEQAWNRHRDGAAPLRGLLGGAFRPFQLEAVHPHLTWRENLVFGAVDAPNSRAEMLSDQALLELVEREGMGEAFTRWGLEFGIGRQGANLSGGQGQLVALGRALLRRTPVVVLDEPTSALDPASRTRVTGLLRAWKAGRIVVTVSHDPEFIRHADDIRVMDGGRLVASGTFAELEAGSEPFRRSLRPK